MTTEQKIEAIKDAITRAEYLDSKMDATAWAVPALSSLRIRHLMNNLGAISTNYLECGVHKGGLFCSAIRNNANLEMAFYNDNWESDRTSGENAQEQFIDNMLNCIDGTEIVACGVQMNTFDVNPMEIPDEIDLYLFDADHSYESQRKAMTHFLPAMADEFILCVDDYDWEDVKKGTQDGLKDATLEVLYERTFIGNDHDNDGWWNGFYVALVKKKK